MSTIEMTSTIDLNKVAGDLSARLGEGGSVFAYEIKKGSIVALYDMGAGEMIVRPANSQDHIFDAQPGDWLVFADRITAFVRTPRAIVRNDNDLVDAVEQVWLEVTGG